MTTGHELPIALHRRSDVAFALFEKDLLADLIPFVEKTYPAKAGREARAG
jgi:hypothetical protein